MAYSDEQKNNKGNGNGNNNLSKPDPETLHTTDPQDNMEGPLSSIVQNIKEKAEDNEEKDKKEDKK